jgi:hypothetical protein
MELGLERTHQVLTSGEKSSTLSLTALNADASWLLTLNNIVRIAIDPWLVGDEIDGCSWFNTQSHAYPCVSPSDVGILTAVILTQGFSDHCHEETLLLLPGSPIVFAAPGALSRARKCLGHARVRPLDALASFLPGWRASHVSPPLLEPTHGAVLIESPNGGSVLVAPHGLRASALNRLRIKCKTISRPLTVLATTATYTLPFWLGGTVNLGLSNAHAICAAVSADVFYSSHSEKKFSRGCVPYLATTHYASAEETAKTISCAARALPANLLHLPPHLPHASNIIPPMPPPQQQISQIDAAVEAPIIAEVLRSIAARAPPVSPDKDIVRVTKSWNSTARTHTFHTHCFIAGADSQALLLRCGELFLNAYGLERHGWYSQFVRGTATDVDPNVSGGGRDGGDGGDGGGGGVDGNSDVRCGWGIFDLGIGSLRAYHTLFTRLQLSDTSLAVVLRTVTPLTPLPPPPLAPSSSSTATAGAAAAAAAAGIVQVFLLPPTGDYFSLGDGGLHWHHICTVRGVRLLPGVCDSWLMNVLRSTGLDVEERATYAREGASFVRFIKAAMKEQEEEEEKKKKEALV